MSNAKPSFVGDLEATTQPTDYVAPDKVRAAVAHPSHLPRDSKVDNNDEKSYPRPSSSSVTLTDYSKDNEKHSTFCPVSIDALIPLPRAQKGQPPPPREKAPACVRFLLWYNTYRKFYTIVLCLNFAGWIATFTGHWTYPLRYPGAMVLGNFLAAVLVRNEVFGRILYAIVNNCFAKVGVSAANDNNHSSGELAVASTHVSISLYINLAASRRNSLRVCNFGFHLAHHQCR